jgi:hypothetical protein
MVILAKALQLCPPWDFSLLFCKVLNIDKVFPKTLLETKRKVDKA